MTRGAGSGWSSLEASFEGEDLALRRWELGDRQELLVARDVSADAFGDWLPGVTKDLADVDRFLTGVASTFAAGTSFHYAIVDAGQVVGQVSLHRRGERVGEIGYWVRSDRVGHGYASRAVRLLTAATLAGADIDMIKILCDEGNARSRRVAEKAGYRHVETRDVTGERTRAQTGREMVWRSA